MNTALAVLAWTVIGLIGFVIGRQRGQKDERRKRIAANGQEWLFREFELVVPAEDFSRIWNHTYNGTVGVTFKTGENAIITTDRLRSQEIPLARALAGGGE